MVGTKVTDLASLALVVGTKVTDLASLALVGVKPVLDDKLLYCEAGLFCGILDVLNNRIVEEDGKAETVEALEIGVEVTMVVLEVIKICALDVGSLDEAE